MSDSPSLARTILGKLLFVVGVLILLAFLAWAILKIVPKVASSIAGVGGAVSGLFSSSTVDASVSPQTVETGEEATLKWSFSGSQKGDFTVSFDCVDGLYVTMEDDGAQKAMICEKEYALGSKAGSVSLTPKLADKDALADAEFRVTFRDEDGQLLDEDEALLTVTSGDGYGAADGGDEAATEGTVETSKTTGGSYSAGAAADLAIHSPNVSGGRMTFTAANQGGRATGPWYFTYSTPTKPQDVFVSPAMVSLAPGEALGVTLRFGEVEDGRHTVTVSADPWNQIAESNESNNSFAVRVDGDRKGGSHGNDDANLEIRDLEAGAADGDDFDEDDSIDERDDAAVRFVVKNTGDERTGSWRYKVFLPGDDYRSSKQDSLDPGEEQEVIVEFGRLDEGSYTIKVELDPDDDVDEEDERDNDDSVKLKVRD
jgi:hypothetical protein